MTREEYEFEDGHIQSINIPMDQIFDSLNKIEKNRKVIVYCNSGRRVLQWFIFLEKFQFDNIQLREDIKNILKINNQF